MSAAIILLTLFLTQTFPTFGKYLFTAGNGIPLGIAIAGYGCFLITSLITGIPRKSFMNATLFTLIFITYCVLTLLLSPLDFGIRNLSILIKIVAMYTSFLAGYYYLSSGGNLKSLYKTVFYILIVHIILFVDHIIDPRSFIQNLYNVKDSVGGYRQFRFPGTWNLPYNEVLFLVPICFYFFYQTLYSQNGTSRFLSFLMCVFVLFMATFGTQSRAGLIGLSLTCIYILFNYIFYSVTWNKGVNVSIGFLMFFVIGLMSYGIYQMLVILETDQTFYHITKLVEEGGVSSANRVEQIQTYYNLYLKDAPIRIFFGFGPARGEDMYIESIVNYLFQYGIIGMIFFFGPWVYLWARLVKKGLQCRKSQEAMAYLLLHSSIFLFMVMQVAMDAFIHFRFIPIFYFLAGVVLFILNHPERAQNKIRS